MPIRTALLMTALVCAAAAHAADPSTSTASAGAQARYKQDIALCNSGKSNQNATTCKVEAERALAESLRGGLTAAAPSVYQQNSLRRCAVFQGDERTACEARMRQPEGVEGSAQSGGVLRENVTIVPVPAQ